MAGIRGGRLSCLFSRELAGLPATPATKALKRAAPRVRECIMLDFCIKVLEYRE
jgi:hypothetical protein